MDALRVGYVRVSSALQSTVRQLDGVPVEKTFTDHASGSSLDRSGLSEMLGFVREGDTVLVHSMDRLARDLDDLLRLVDQLTAKGVGVEFVKEGLAFTGDDSLAKLMLGIMGSVAEFERALIRERQAEGIAKAKARGVYKGRKAKLEEAAAAAMVARAQAGESRAALAREYGISRETVYAYLRAGERAKIPATMSQESWRGRGGGR
uniref:recombinase family protein n=1 Tax=Sinomonas albida TaxID=369942 RepID=UPI001B3C92AC|nr:recombinase family protein [Sinomonas albida]